MDVLFGEQAWICGVLLRGKAHQPIVVQIHLQRVEVRYQHIHAQIVLETVYEVWVSDVLACQHAFLFADSCVMGHNFDSTAATSRHWFQNPQRVWVTFALGLECVHIFT